jgi:SAM-dependent methyltransferase
MKEATPVATDTNTDTRRAEKKKRKTQGLGRKVQDAVTRFRQRLARAIDPTVYLECPCCGEQAATFLPHGTKNLPNRKCPGCGSLERHRLHWIYLRDRTNLLKDPLKVLHFAPEVALQKLLKSQSRLDYHSADLSSKRAAEHFDICAIPYPDNTFDVVLCSHVLEHVPDDRKAMAELFRVMKPGGWGLIEAPVTTSLVQTLEDPSVTSDEERTRLFGQRDHVRKYGRDYYTRLRSAGFEVVTHRFAKELDPRLVQKYRLNDRGSITISTKPPR